MLRLAEEFGLEFVEIQNLTEFYEDYRYVSFLTSIEYRFGVTPHSHVRRAGALRTL